VNALRTIVAAPPARVSVADIERLSRGTIYAATPGCHLLIEPGRIPPTREPEGLIACQSPTSRRW
jgi:hypothetical protein